MKILILSMLFVGVFVMSTISAEMSLNQSETEEVQTEVEHKRGCLWVLGRCVHPCPEGTHGFLSECGGSSPTWSEPTCSKPEKYDLGEICDLTRCDCDEPTVRDETTGRCVKLEECPSEESIEPEE